VNASSAVNTLNDSTIAWAIIKRSNGSR